MLIAQAPVRISFAEGGTDLEACFFFVDSAHVSTDILSKQRDASAQEKPDVIDALHAIKQAASATGLSGLTFGFSSVQSRSS